MVIHPSSPSGSTLLKNHCWFWAFLLYQEVQSELPWPRPVFCHSLKLGSCSDTVISHQFTWVLNVWNSQEPIYNYSPLLYEYSTEQWHMNRLAIETGFLLGNLSEEELVNKRQWETILSPLRHHTSISWCWSPISWNLSEFLFLHFLFSVVRHTERWGEGCGKSCACMLEPSYRKQVGILEMTLSLKQFFFSEKRLHYIRLELFCIGFKFN